MNRVIFNASVVLVACAAAAHGQFSAVSGEEYTIDSGVLQIVETVEIPATATGPIQHVHVEQGALIEAGQILATIDDEDTKIALEEAEIDLEIIAAQAASNVDIDFAEKSRLVALADYRRAQESNRSYAGVVSAREMDRLKLLVEQSDAELEKIKFEKSILQMQKKLKAAVVRRNRIDVDRHKIRSALSGQIIEIKKAPGEWVNVADPVFKVVRLDRLRVEEYLPAAIAFGGLTGTGAVFRSEMLKENEIGAVSGRVVFVSPNVDPLNSTVQIWIEFENPELRLRPGMKGRVTIDTSSSTGKSVDQASAGR